MAILRKYETVTDINVYEAELTEEQYHLYLQDEERFIDEVAGELDWDFCHDKAGDPDIEYDIV